jgi:hypothetical protein
MTYEKNGKEVEMKISQLFPKRHGTHTKRGTWVLLLGLTSVLAAPPWISAQSTTASLVGTVADSTGAIIPGADITVKNIGTGEVRREKSAADGGYAINLLPPGTYSVTVSMPSFKTSKIANVTLAAGDKPRVDANLQIGTSSDTVTVESTTPLMQSESATVQDSINQKAVQDIPLNGRDFVQLVQMVPGGNEGPPGGLTNGTKPDDKRQSATISVNGQSDVLNNNMIDGMDNNERLIGSIGLRPSVESISEIHVQSAVYSADTGRTPGAAIDIISKSGSNQFHGSLFEFFRNDIFDANAFQFGAHNPKTELRQNQYGGSLGGPVLHNKLFFFGDYEGYNLVSDGPPSITNVPTAAQKADPSSLLPAGRTMDPVGLQYFNMYPAPNDGDTPNGTQGQYVGIAKTTQESKVIDSRGDYNYNTNNTLFVRYAYNIVHTWQPGVLPYVTMGGLTFDPSAAGAEGGGGYSPEVAHNAALGYIHTFSPGLLLSLQTGYLRVDNRTFPPAFGDSNVTGPSISAALGQPNVNDASIAAGQGGGLGRVQTSGGYGNLGGSPGGGPLEDFTEAFQFQGTVIYTHGPHTLKFGSQLLRRWATSVGSTNALPVWQFANLGGLLSGTYTSVARNLDLDVPSYRWWELGEFAQDDWHATRNLTLNIGVRWDAYTNKTSPHNTLSNWSIAQSALVVAGTNGVSASTNVRNTWSLFAPRFGFDYTVRPGLLVRGGFGISYYPSDITSSPNLKNQPFIHAYGPFTTAQALADPTYSSMAYLAGGSIPVVASPASTPVGAVRGVAANFRPGTAIQFDIATQKDFGGNVFTADYVGILGRHAPQALTDLNAPPPAAYASGTAAQAARPYYSLYPKMTTVAWFASEGVSSYNGVNLSFERRFKNGLSYNVNYNYSRILDNYASLSNGGNEGYGYNVNAIPGTSPAMGYANGASYEYGNSDLDIRNHAAATANYLLPFFKSEAGVEGKVLGSWQVNLLGAWTAGQPFTVTNSSNASGQAYGIATSDRPNLVGAPMLPSAQRGIATYINKEAFQKQAAGALGSEARNVAYGPHFRHVDLSLIKTIPIRENLHAEFRAEAFNITNTTNFATPNASLGSATFGALTATSANYQPRVFQFALKFAF